MSILKMTMMSGTALVIVAACMSIAAFPPVASAQVAPPQYKVDPYWPKELPNNWIVGQIGGMNVDSQNHIWVLQRPGSNTPDEISAAPEFPAPRNVLFSCSASA